MFKGMNRMCIVKTPVENSVGSRLVREHTVGGGITEF